MFQFAPSSACQIPLRSGLPSPVRAARYVGACGGGDAAPLAGVPARCCAWTIDITTHAMKNAVTTSFVVCFTRCSAFQMEISKMHHSCIGNPKFRNRKLDGSPWHRQSNLRFRNFGFPMQESCIFEISDFLKTGLQNPHFRSGSAKTQRLYPVVGG